MRVKNGQMFEGREHSKGDTRIIRVLGKMKGSTFLKRSSGFKKGVSQPNYVDPECTYCLCSIISIPLRGRGVTLIRQDRLCSKGHWMPLYGTKML